jgi:hypothetical protein
VQVFDVKNMNASVTDIGNFKRIGQYKPVQAFSASGGIQGTQATANTWTTRFGDDGGTVDQRGCVHAFDKATGYDILGMRPPGEQENSYVNRPVLQVALATKPPFLFL